jgi:bacterioferritin-associated ferredoxin
MAPVFIFARDVEDVIREGKRTIEVPEGARISAAALDLIRDNRLEITYLPPRSAPPEEITSEAAAQTQAGKEPEPATDPTAATITTEGVSAEEVNAIVDRVITRLRQIKGDVEPSGQTTEAAAPAEDDDLVICRCEEITKGEIRAAIQNGMTTLNGIKRVTRAGMGLCQGQTCQRLVTQLLAAELGYSATEIEPTTARAPVRPLPLSAFATG